METIAKIRRDRHVHGLSIKAIARTRKLSRNTVRKVLRSGMTEQRYRRTTQPRRQLGTHIEQLDALLERQAAPAHRERWTMLRIYELLRAEGYGGGYDAVRRYARAWQRRRGHGLTQAFVPLAFAPGEAFQFDWSHETVVVDGTTQTVKVAQVRLCHSRMPFVRAYPRETQEMVFDAHAHAFAYFGGACTRGIYDNMSTAVDAVFAGKARQFNRRFAQMCSHYLIEPTACSPGAGWEKGQVESQVQNTRERLFTPRLHVESFAALNAYLVDHCMREAHRLRHPEVPTLSVHEMFEHERAVLIPYVSTFDGFRPQMASASKTCLVRVDRNRYSVNAAAAGRAVEVHAYAERIVIRCDGAIVGEHDRCFGRDRVIYDPWHYLPVLARKPGALRNGAPFKDWALPESLQRVREHFAQRDDGDRQMVQVLCAVLTESLDDVAVACAAALAAGVVSATVILNQLSRRHAPTVIAPLDLPAALHLTQAPVADCGRYDGLRKERRHATA